MTTDKELFKKGLQLASFVSIHALVLAVELSDPELLPHCQEHWVLVEDLLHDGDPHVSALVSRSVKMLARCFVKLGSWLNITPMGRHPGPEFRNCFSYILEPTSGLGAVDTVHHVGGPTVHGGVDGGHSRGLGGLDLLPFLDIVTGAAVTTFSHSFLLSHRSRVWDRGRGNFSSDELVPDGWRPAVSYHRRFLENLR